MEQKIKQICYDEYASVAELSIADQELMNEAIAASKGAYAPYSHFHVGAALRTADGAIHIGNNQENAAYPSGLCAERTALFAASASHPTMRDYEALAIVGCNADGLLCEASPCGACRQVMSEYEGQQGHSMRVVCYVNDHCIRVFHSVADLLPFGFDF